MFLPREADFALREVTILACLIFEWGDLTKVGTMIPVCICLWNLTRCNIFLVESEKQNLQWKIFVDLRRVWAHSVVRPNDVNVLVSVLVLPVLVSGDSSVHYDVLGTFSARGVRSIPSIPTAAYAIKIYDSNIQKIEAGSFSNVNPTQIMFWNNQIDVIEDGAFNGLNSLTEFQMWNTNVSVIKTGAFRGFNNLRYVKMWNNVISTIETLALSGFENLSEITIWNNIFRKIERMGITWSNTRAIITRWNNVIEICEGSACIGLYHTSGITTKYSF